MPNWPKVKLCLVKRRLEHCSESHVWPLESLSGHYTCPNSHERLTKIKIMQLGVGSNIALKHLFSPYLVIIYPQIDQKWK